MSEHQVNNAKKGRLQDYLGVTLCAAGGFGAVSVLMQFFGNATPKWRILEVFTGIEGLLGILPTFMAMLALAVLGCVLFLRSEAIDSGRYLLGIFGVVLGISLLSGGLNSASGGSIGGAVTEALGSGWLGRFLSILLGFFVVGASAYLAWASVLLPLVTGLSGAVAGLRAVSKDSPGMRVGPSDRSDPDSEGVTADEAAALVPEGAAAPPQRRAPFRPTVSEKTIPAQAPAARVEAPRPANAQKSTSVKASPAGAQQAMEQTTVDSSHAPDSGSIEKIAQALARATGTTSTTVPDELRGPNVEDDIRSIGGIPEGARALDSGARVAAPDASTPVEVPAAGKDAYAHEGPPIQPSDTEDLLAELQAANERLKILDEEAQRLASGGALEAPSGETTKSYWSRDEAQASTVEQDAATGSPAGQSTEPAPKQGGEASGSKWDGNTWRPSWETSAGDETAGEASGPVASWEQSETQQLEVSPDTSVPAIGEAIGGEATELIAAEEVEPQGEEEEYEEEEAEDEGEYEEEDEDEEYEDEEDEEDDDEEYEDEEEGEEEEEDEDEGEYEEGDEEDEEYEDEEDEDEEEDEGDEEYEDEEEDDEEYEDEEDAEAEDEDGDGEENAEYEEEDEEPEVELEPAAAPKAQSKSAGKQAKDDSSKETQSDLFEPTDSKSAKPAPAADKSEAKPKPPTKAQLKAAAKKAAKAAALAEAEAVVLLQPSTPKKDKPAKASPKAPKPKAKNKATPSPDPTLTVEPRVYAAGVMFLEEKRVAVSMLQKKHEMDFDEACEILDKLQEIGLIGPYLGGKTRDILLTLEEWEALARGATQA